MLDNKKITIRVTFTIKQTMDALAPDLQYIGALNPFQAYG